LRGLSEYGFPNYLRDYILTRLSSKHWPTIAAKGTSVFNSSHNHCPLGLHSKKNQLPFASTPKSKDPDLSPLSLRYKWILFSISGGGVMMRCSSSMVKGRQSTTFSSKPPVSIEQETILPFGRANERTSKTFGQQFPTLK
jgi:hypothetical protein